MITATMVSFELDELFIVIQSCHHDLAFVMSLL